MQQVLHQFPDEQLFSRACAQDQTCNHERCRQDFSHARSVSVLIVHDTSFFTWKQLAEDFREEFDFVL